MEVSLPQSVINDFQRDGAVCLRSVFTEDRISDIIKGIEKNLANPSKYSEHLKTKQGPGVYFNDYCNWQKIEEFRKFAITSPAAKIAADLMTSKRAVFYHDHVLTKDAGSYSETPWHQDQPYYPLNGFQNLSLWIPVDPVSIETTIQFIRGSHKWGKWFYPRKFASCLNYAIERPEDMSQNFESIPDIDKEVENGEMDIIKWEVKPGDCIAFHMLTVHGAPANTSDTPRRVLSTRWLGDDATFAERPWRVSPPIDGGLKPGDDFECDTFPLVYSRQ